MISEEIYSLQLPSDIPFAIRLDGRCFTSFTERMGYEHPYDSQFRDVMVEVSKGFVEEFNTKIAYLQSDEINLLFGSESDLFHRRVDKLLSVTASYTSSKFTQEAEVKDEVVTFDSRVILLQSTEMVLDYFASRHMDAARNALSSWSYWTLRKESIPIPDIVSALRGMRAEGRKEMLAEHGIEYPEIPAWQKRGVMVHWEEYLKEGIDRRTGEKRIGKRRRIHVEEELPAGEEFRWYLGMLLEGLFSEV